MAKKTIILFLFIITYNINAFSQSINLVPNSSFEEYIICPPNCATGSLNYCKNWFSGLGLNCSSDYFNSCSLDNGCIFAINSQPPKTGNGMAGIALYQKFVDSREYIMNKLTDALKENKRYCGKFYVSLSNYSSGAIENIGMYFTSDSLFTFGTYGLLLKQPQIENNNGIIKDTLNWIKISGTFIASGQEKYLVVGNFRDNVHTNYTDVFFGETDPYYLFDDVSVCNCEDFNISLGNDTTLCAGQQLLLQPNMPKEVDSVVYTWQDGSHNKTFTVSQAGTYSVSAYIQDYNITVSASIRVNYGNCNASPSIWLPNSFTPNGDGLNDKFEYTNAAYYNIKTYIYNRWGQLIFEGENTNFWDGTYKGNAVQMGVYTYSIIATEKGSKIEKIYSGKVIVVR